MNRYYDNELIEFTVDGKIRKMTEQQAEQLADQGHDVVSLVDMIDGLPAGAQDQILDCTCPGDGSAGTCYWCRNQYSDPSEIPFE